MKALTDKYIILINTYVKVNLKYPLELFLKLIYLPIQLFMYIFLWKSLLSYDAFEFSYMICYYLFVILLGYAFPFAHIATDIQSDVEGGILSNFLVRPIGYIVPKVCKFIAWMVCYSVVFIPALIFVFFYGNIKPLNLLYFFVYLLIGLVVEFLLWYNVGLLALKIEKIRGAMTAFKALRMLASGSLIPIYLFPDILQGILMYLPFKLYIYTPINVLLSGESSEAFFLNILTGIIWVMFLTLLAKIQWRSGIAKLQINIS
ncbi:ABC-2 family transporter protein [Acetivibrio ethanolgignens]|uniref:ABC transporter permease n=1 Tax=Acetivibrio ethanolgignens TaxID=290052 RepID=A0A0V8QCK1_9FIRM|nr:ABC-2 family transporter protein [Acetivibrio ethanolgignens]KSV58277.1 hypothetical protein ASU35_13275 [Acetivibrio ethanolgignens]KSV60245.1 hypothetical protein ASU35_17165 [Acetivibrio ethanolgignens]